VRRCGSCDNLFFTFEAALGSSQWANDEFCGDQCITLPLTGRKGSCVGVAEALCVWGGAVHSRGLFEHFMGYKDTLTVLR